MMSDEGEDGGAAAKRRKASEGDLLRRIDALETEIYGLRLQVAAVEGHRQQHVSLPLTTVTRTYVDLSSIDSVLILQVASFFGLSRELLNLALTCKAFGWRQQLSNQMSSLVEEAARQLVVNRLKPSDVEWKELPSCNNDTTAWLTTLHELERLRQPLRFGKLIGSGIRCSGNERRVKKDSGHHNYCSDVANFKAGTNCTAMTKSTMRRGVHYASFSGDFTIVGVARPLRDFLPNVFGEFDMLEGWYFKSLRAQRTDGWVGNVHCCQIDCRYGGYAGWSDWRQRYRDDIYFEGYEPFGRDDTAGLLVDLNAGTLTVYKNGRRLGVAKDGLAGEYCFFAALDDGEVSVERGFPP